MRFKAPDSMPTGRSLENRADGGGRALLLGTTSDGHYLCQSTASALLPPATDTAWRQHLREGRILDAADLRRYKLFYADRIKEISFGALKATLSSDAVNALFVATGSTFGALSPSLRSISVPASTLEAARPRYTDLFLGEGVTEFQFDHRDFEGPETLDPLAITECLQRPSNLTSMDLSTGISVSGVILNHVLAVCSSHLQHLRLHELPIQDLGRLRPLQHLASLEIAYLTERLGPHVSSVTFPVLEVLSIKQTYTFSSLVTIVRCLPRENALRTLYCKVTNYRRTRDTEVSIDALLQRLNPCTLEHLSVIVYPLSDREDDTEPRDLDLKEVTELPLRLFEFKQLVTLKINIPDGFKVTAQPLSTFPNIWPQMQTFDSLPSTPTGQAPYISHLDIVDLVGRWRSLRRLGLRFDASRVTGLEEGPLNSLRELNVGESYIASPSRVTRWIINTFPSLMFLDASGYDSWTTDEDWTPNMLALRWMDVMDGFEDR